ncbi:histidine phosphatase superfamily [Amylocarpus encephaloides]|uniref:Histidine phosphatase superfamily n=1 Tax=Amylocarpus encephaloides TaxID=45428 RepID=A0A9P7YJ73_9HELO|nr:histidine phosphatase superfamily [Amylocarpus encephaloides]
MYQSWGLSASLAVSQFVLPTLSTQFPLFPQSHPEGYQFNPLLHLPGISPYFDAIGSGLDHGAPRYCEVTAASYLVRHAAIYANDNDYEQFMEPFLKKLSSTYSRASGKTRKGWKGPLKFFDKWQTPIPDPENQLEEITPQGIQDSKKVGKHLLSRYPKLVPTTKTIYADKKARTQDTAKAFVKVFPQKVEVVQMDIENKTSFHSQDPHKACNAFSKKPGDEELGKFTEIYTPPIIARLAPFSPVDLEPKDIMGLQQLCGYESAITGKVSKICDVFTDSEWMAYEYAWDMKYSLMVGHGNPLSPYLGFPWLNTTSKLMSKFHAPMHDDSNPEIPDDDGQRFFLAFTHREVPPFIATALGLFNSSNAHAEDFPLDKINWSRSWRMTELIPFLGHVGIEKLTCDIPGGQKPSEYIRIIANSAPRPIPDCQDGPGSSCNFDRFTEIVELGMQVYGDFDGICQNNGNDGTKTELWR